MSSWQNLWVPSPQLSSPILQPWLWFFLSCILVCESRIPSCPSFKRDSGQQGISRFPATAHGISCTRICGLWRCVSSQLPSPLLTMSTRDFICLAGLYRRVHWKWRMSRQSSAGCVACVVCVRDWALHGCYMKICTKAEKSLLWSKCGFAPDQISSQVVLFCDLPTDISTQYMYQGSWD
jgi:hypothetical protein